MRGLIVAMEQLLFIIFVIMAFISSSQLLLIRFIITFQPGHVMLQELSEGIPFIFQQFFITDGATLTENGSKAGKNKSFIQKNFVRDESNEKNRVLNVLNQRF